MELNLEFSQEEILELLKMIKQYKDVYVLNTEQAAILAKIYIAIGEGL